MSGWRPSRTESPARGRRAEDVERVPFSWAAAIMVGAAIGLVLVLAVGALVSGCYKPGPMPPPCANIMDCDDPTAPPWPPPSMMAKRDAGADGAADGGAR